MKTGVQNNAVSLWAKRAEIFFWFVPPIVTFWGTLVANEVKKFFQMNLFGGKTAVWRAIAPRATFLATLLNLAHSL